MAKFGERLKELRKEKRLTQQQMADMFDVYIRTYQTYEYDESYPIFVKLIAFADFFDVSLDYLVGRSDIRERR